MRMPVLNLRGPDGNVLVVLAAARRELIDAGRKDEVDKMLREATSVGSYDAALQVVQSYVDIVFLKE